MAARSKRFTFTLNNYNDHDLYQLSQLPCRYMIVGREVSSTGTPHLQGYVTFENGRSLAAVRTGHLARCHVEVPAYDSLVCIRYCAKGGNFTERGKCPVRESIAAAESSGPPSTSNTVASISSSVRSRFNEWSDNEGDDEDGTGTDELDTASALARLTTSPSTSTATTRHGDKGEAKRQRILQILEANNYDPLAVYREDKYLYANHYVQIERICKAEQQHAHDQSPRAWKTKVFVYTGNPGSGKTYYAQRRMKGLGLAVYTKDTSEWWPNYRQQPVVFMDEYNDWFEWDQLLRLMSQLPETVPVKNSQAVFNARYLFITTHRDPNTWYSGVPGYDKQALLDRIDEWRVFEKRGPNEYRSELKRNYKDESRRFLSMDEVEPILEEDEEVGEQGDSEAVRDVENRVNQEVHSSTTSRKRSAFAALMGVDELELPRAALGAKRVPMACLDNYERTKNKN